MPSLSSQINGSNVTGNHPVVEAREKVKGGQFMRNIGGELLRTLERTPQVQNRGYREIRTGFEPRVHCCWLNRSVIAVVVVTAGGGDHQRHLVQVLRRLWLRVVRGQHPRRHGNLPISRCGFGPKPLLPSATPRENSNHEEVTAFGGLICFRFGRPGDPADRHRDGIHWERLYHDWGRRMRSSRSHG